MSIHKVNIVLLAALDFFPFSGSSSGVKNSPWAPLMAVVSAGSLRTEAMLFPRINASSPHLHGIVLMLLLPPSSLLLPSSLPTGAAAAILTTPKLICLKLCSLVLEPEPWTVSSQLWLWK